MSYAVELHRDGYMPSRDSTEAQFYVHGIGDDPLAAYAALTSTVSYLLSNGHWLQAADLGGVIGTHNGETWWLATVTWGIQQGANLVTAPTATPVLKGTTRGGTQHITQALEHINTYLDPAATLDPPNHKGAIGVTKNGVQGVNIIVPAFSWSLAIRVPTATVSDAYIMNLESLTGCVNDDTYYGRAAGEVRFEGADFQQMGDEFEFVFFFASQRNVEDQQIGDIDEIDKDGWDYLWIEYQEEEDTGAKALVSIPMAAHVERVSPRANFALLGV